MQGLLKSFSCAAKGIFLVAATQRNMKIHIGITVGVLGAGWFFHITRTEWLILIITILMVLMGEMLNTALEKVVDLVSPEYHVLAGQAKDIAAGAVLLAAMGAVVVGILLFGPYVVSFWKQSLC